LPHHRDKDLELKTVIHQWSNWVELLSYMRLFVEVARTKSFRRAADALDMPNSTLSRHIAELEKTIGLRLLHRSTRKVELTEAGEVYFKRCQSIAWRETDSNFRSLSRKRGSHRPL
jgi:DNA-binding transcriptional LysR family regulator